MNNIIVFDTETTGFSPVYNEIVQLSYILYDTDKQTVIYATSPGSDIVKINGKIPKETSDVHGITKEMTLDKRPIKEHIDEFIFYCNQASKFVGHNVKFDIKMITGQIEKFDVNVEERAKYNEFLSKFGMVDKVVKKKTTKVLPDTAYCTMAESQGICAQLKGVKKLKNEKLMEVHKLLFNQDVGGQLHNALVDISVTLRVYLKLTMDIDICQSMNNLPDSVTTVTNNNEICNLIKPIPIQEKTVEQIDYSGPLITGLVTTPRGLVEKTVNVQTIANKMATDLVTGVLSTTISVCTKQPDTEVEECQTVKPIIAKYSENFVSRLMSPFTRNNKVVPIGGRRTNNVSPIGGKKTKRRVKKRKTIKRKRNKRYYK